MKNHYEDGSAPFFHRERVSKATKDGRYRYFSVDGSVFTLTPGENGFTEEWLVLLSEMDHEEDLHGRYEAENQDYGYENFKADKEKNCTDEEYAPMATAGAEPFHALFEAEDETDFRVEMLSAFIRTLPEDRQNLLYAYYGEQKYLAEITAEENAAKGTAVSYQAVQKRLKKAIASCCEFCGMPMPKFRGK